MPNYEFVSNSIGVNFNPEESQAEEVQEESFQTPTE